MRKRANAFSDKAKNSVGVVYRPLHELKLDPNNPRVHSPRQVRQIARSIEAFGFNVPVLVDTNLTVLAGHGRIRACQLLGWNGVPTIQLEHLSEAQARAFMIADNRLTENSTWDDRLLAEQLKQLSELELDFDLEATGFTIGEIDLRIEGLEPAAGRNTDPADVMPPATVGPPVSRAGDVWLLGHHRILCASALKEAAYLQLMEGQRAAMVFTDPPYNVPIEGNVSGLGAIHHRDFVMGSGEMNEAEFTAFLTQACSLLARHSREVRSTSYSSTGGTRANFWPRGVRFILSLRISAYGSKTMVAWARSTAHAMNSYSSSNTAAHRIETTSSLASSGATGQMCGSTQAPARSRGPGRKAICFHCIPPSNPPRWWRMRLWTRRRAAISYLTAFSAAAPP